MANSRKFVAKTKDVSLTVKRAESFSISYVDCEKDMFQIEENQDGIKFFQREKASACYWFGWLAKGNPEVVIMLPEDVDVCEIEAEVNQVLVTDIKADKIYVKVKNGKAAVRNVQANDVFIKCVNGKAVAHNVESTTSCTVDTLNGMSVLEGAITRDASIEVTCKNGITEVSDKNKVNLGCRTYGCAHYVVHCLNGKAAVK
ncbi:DUF4097 family beta strand repeat-containing protein [Lactobacillus iners]|nr:DUF4097 family beta strand repeat-containing protein [Lactobacillus iners]EFO71888.1 hypothetical protein HMPREF9215_0793 [Lactobacillus iners SPIN 2503V10-D]EFQ49461.1 hypothetical protein HMPREF9217_1123 [Lactobacillus iners LEAF 2052A-d]